MKRAPKTMVSPFIYGRSQIDNPGPGELFQEKGEKACCVPNVPKEFAGIIPETLLASWYAVVLAEVVDGKMTGRNHAVYCQAIDETSRATMIRLRREEAQYEGQKAIIFHRPKQGHQ